MALAARAKWLKFRDSRDPASLRVILLLVALTTTLGIYLTTGPRPWDDSIVKRLAAGRELKLSQIIQLGVWWGAAAGFLAGFIGLATVRWWSLPHVAVFPELQPPSRRSVHWTWGFALAATLLAIWPRYARLDHSLWNDEEYHLRTYVLGTWEPNGSDGGASLQLDPITWPEAIFGNEKGNNHVWSSIEVRIGHLLGGHDWTTGTGFSETSLRIFPFITGLLTVGSLVLLGAAMGNPRAGLAAGLILALHPWHVRWSVEIRGYSTMLFAITAGLLCLLHALKSNRWRGWLGYGACQTLTLLCFAGSFYFVASLNLVALILIARAPAASPVRLSAGSRLITSGILAFIPAALILGPHVPQVAAYLKSGHDYPPIDAAWLHDLWSHLVVGLRPVSDPNGTSAGLSLQEMMTIAPWNKVLVYAVLPLMLVAGLFQLFRQDWRTRLIAGSFSAAGLLAVVHNALSGSAFVTWYLLYLLPLFVFSIVWAALLLMKWWNAGSGSLPLIFAAIYSFFATPALSRIMHVPRQPIRETVEVMRGPSRLPGETDPGILTASIGAGARQMLSYDPRLQIVKSPSDLQAITADAIATSRPLFLSIRGPGSAAMESPELIDAVTTDPRWKRLPPVLGMEAMLSYDVYQFDPVSVDRLQLNP